MVDFDVLLTSISQCKFQPGMTPGKMIGSDKHVASQTSGSNAKTNALLSVLCQLCDWQC